MLEKYIPPSLKEIFSNNPDKAEIDFKHDDIFNDKNWIVLAEPGYGKSRFLFQTLKNFEEKGFQCCQIDLKQLETTRIQEFISQQLKKLRPKSRLIEFPHFYATDNFKLHDELPTLYCFDALDELSQNYLSRTIDAIFDLKNDFPNTTFIVSCRIHHLRERFKILKFGIHSEL